MRNSFMSRKRSLRTVINKFGKENMINLLILMKELDTVMESEIEEMQVVKNDDESDENE